MTLHMQMNLIDRNVSVIQWNNGICCYDSRMIKFVPSNVNPAELVNCDSHQLYQFSQYLIPTKIFVTIKKYSSLPRCSFGRGLFYHTSLFSSIKSSTIFILNIFKDLLKSF